AQQLVKDLIPVRNAARDAHDMSALQQLDRDVAWEYDLRNCGCPTPLHDVQDAQSATVADVRPVVVRASSYPAEFEAEVLLSGMTGNYREVVVLRRDAVDRPWQIAFDTVSKVRGPTLTMLMTGRFDADNFAAAPSAVEEGRGRAMLNALVAQWRAQK